MNDYNSDQAKELRRARVLQIRPKAAPEMMPRKKVQEDYIEPLVVPRAFMPSLEERHNVMFCPACQEQYNDTMVSARMLHAGYEDDPLRNFAALLTLTCMGCNWNEIVPIPAASKLGAEQQKIVMQMHNSIAKQRMEMYRHDPGMILRTDMYNSALVDQQLLNQAQGLGVLKFGSNIAERVWGEYQQYEKGLEEVKQAEQYLEAERQRQVAINEMANELKKSIDKDILDSIKKSAPPPPSAFDKIKEYFR